MKTKEKGEPKERTYLKMEEMTRKKERDLEKQNAHKKKMKQQERKIWNKWKIMHGKPRKTDTTRPS